MGGFPTISETVDYLRSHGMAGMAVAVELLEASYRRARAANEQNLRAIYELRAKYEPAAFAYPDHRAPPESDG